MSSNPVYLFAKWYIKQGNLDAVLALLPELAKKSREEKGNLLYKIHQSIDDENILLLYEGYADQSSVSDHRSSIHFQEIVIGKIVPLLESREAVLSTALSV